MKILQIIPNLASGGAERFVCELSNELSGKDNVELSILTLFSLNVSNSHCKHALSDRVALDSLDKRLRFDLKILWKVYQYIRKNKFDIVHAHLCAIPYILLGALFLRHVSFYATIHSDAYFESGSFFQKMIRKILFKFNLCTPIAISAISEKSFSKLYKRNAEIIVNGISPYENKEIINPLSRYKGKVFLHVASLQPVKNQKKLVVVFDKLINQGYDISLVMMGDCSTYPNIYNELQPYFSDRIVHIGLQKSPRDYMRFAEGLCLSSDIEGMPMTIIEAFSVGCPSFCTPVGGCINMIDNSVNGFLAEDMSDAAYYRMIEQYLHLSEEEKNTIRKNAENTFDSYDISVIAGKYLQLFKNHIQ